MSPLRYIILTPLLAIIACSPERDNPLDPRSPGYTGTAGLRGWVRNFVGNPIQDASVSANDLTGQVSVSTLTDGEGSFTLSLYKGTYEVTASKDGYMESTAEITLEAGEQEELFFNINGIPFFMDQIAVSNRMATWIGSVVDINVSTEADDPDGIQDIDSVYVVVEDIKKEMEFSPQSQRFECRISESECPGGNPVLLVGSPFVATAIDEKGARCYSGDFYLVRVFSEFPRSIHPPDGATVSAETLQLIWHRLRTDFPITYLAQIFVGWPPETVWEQSTLDTVSFVDTTLSDGEYYYWVVAEDEYGDKARSIAKRFRVE